MLLDSHPELPLPTTFTVEMNIEIDAFRKKLEFPFQ